MIIILIPCIFYSLEVPIQDLKALKSTPYYESIKKFAFEEIIEISSFEEITNIKKLQGYDNAKVEYR